jgi:hypothetical protein
VRAAVVVLVLEPVEQGLQGGDGGWLGRLSAEPFLQRLVEALDAPMFVKRRRSSKWSLLIPSAVRLEVGPGGFVVAHADDGHDVESAVGGAIAAAAESVPARILCPRIYREPRSFWDPLTASIRTGAA